jgi:hypothetical protein
LIEPADVCCARRKADKHKADKQICLIGRTPR